MKNNNLKKYSSNIRCKVRKRKDFGMQKIQLGRGGYGMVGIADEIHREQSHWVRQVGQNDGF